MGSDNSGAIFIHRKIRDNFLWKERRVFSKVEAWFDMLMEVRWQESTDKVLIGSRVLECRYGQSLNSLETWARRWNWSRSSVLRFFKLLQSESMIRYESETVTARITICNFYDYQHLRNASETHLKRNRNASETHLNTEEEVKEVKERRTKPGGNGKSIYLPSWLDPGIWAAFLEHRVRLRKPMTDHAKGLLFSKLESLTGKGFDPSGLLNEAIEKGWLTVYEPKQGDRTAPAKQSGLRNHGLPEGFPY